jgi:predicted ATP-binding protein involved in virulence
MIKIKSLYLKNYCGYKDTLFSFVDSFGEIVPLSVFFGPNGCGKSTCLQAIRLLCSASDLRNKSLDLLFKSIVRNDDYNPDISGYTIPEESMEVKGIFIKDGEEKEIIIKAEYKSEIKTMTLEECKDYVNNNTSIVSYRDISSKKSQVDKNDYLFIYFNGGVCKNDLFSAGDSFCYFLDADHPINMKKFQIKEQDADLFKEISECVYGYKCSLSAPVFSGENEFEQKFYTDFILEKGNGQTKIHFKRFSDGEKKIATLVRFLCDSSSVNKSDIVLIDNIEMHIYFKRHPKLVDKILEKFPNKQFLVTTHSSSLIEHVKNLNIIKNKEGDTGLFDIDKYKPEQSMTL